MDLNNNLEYFAKSHAKIAASAANVPLLEFLPQTRPDVDREECVISKIRGKTTICGIEITNAESSRAVSQ